MHRREGRVVEGGRFVLLVDHARTEECAVLGALPLAALLGSVLGREDEPLRKPFLLGGIHAYVRQAPPPSQEERDGTSSSESSQMGREGASASSSHRGWERCMGFRSEMEMKERVFLLTRCNLLCASSPFVATMLDIRRAGYTCVCVVPAHARHELAVLPRLPPSFSPARRRHRGRARMRLVPRVETRGKVRDSVLSLLSASFFVLSRSLSLFRFARSFSLRMWVVGALYGGRLVSHPPIRCAASGLHFANAFPPEPTTPYHTYRAYHTYQ